MIHRFSFTEGVELFMEFTRDMYLWIKINKILERPFTWTCHDMMCELIGYISYNNRPTLLSMSLQLTGNSRIYRGFFTAMYLVIDSFLSFGVK